MQFRGGMNELMRQAARMQRKVDQVKKELETKELEFSAVGGKVIATVTLARRVARIQVDPEFAKSESLDVILDSVCVAINQGLEEAGKQMDAEVEKATGGMKIPGVT